MVRKPEKINWKAAAVLAKTVAWAVAQFGTTKAWPDDAAIGAKVAELAVKPKLDADTIASVTAKAIAAVAKLKPIIK